jgi:hypothetical protein
MTEQTECPCACHHGKPGRVSHYQYGQTMHYEPTPCACTIRGNLNYIEQA